jgi:hypothetical protein
MVPARQPSASAAIANWQEHIDGKPQYGPPILPLAPAKFTGSLYLVGSKAIPECTNFNSSLQNSTSSFVQSVLSKVPGGTPGIAWLYVLGCRMFWSEVMYVLHRRIVARAEWEQGDSFRYTKYQCRH